MNSRIKDTFINNVLIIFLLCLFPNILSAQIVVTFTFNPDNACSGTTIQFQSDVDNGGSSPYIFQWNFGDATTSNLANPTHVYSATGCNEQIFNVTLTVTDTTGGGNVSDSYTDNVTVKRRPAPQLIDLDNEPDFSNCDNNPTPADPEFQVQVQNTTPNNGCISNYSINWGDGNPLLSNLTNSDFPIYHTYTELGAFTLTFTALGNNGCQGTASYQVKNQSNPANGIGGFGGTTGCAPKTFSYEVTSYENDAPGTTYLWNFDDGSPTVLWTLDSVFAHNGVISHTFTTSSCGHLNDQFIVSVTASNSCSSTSASLSGTKIYASPRADFNTNPATGCVNTTCFAFPNTTIPGGYGDDCSDSTEYHWDFGNGSTSDSASPACRHYTSPGNYTVTLDAWNQCDTTSISKIISVQDIPVAIAVPNQDDGCVPFDVSFSNTSTGIGIQYAWAIVPSTGWSFISGNSQSKNPVIKFTTAGIYTVTLTVTNACTSDDISFTIVAKDIPAINIPNIEDNCVNYIYTGNVIYDTNGSQITSYFWSVDPPTGWNFVPPSNSGSANPEIRFSIAGSYQVTVQAMNECGTASQTSNTFDIVTQEPVDAGDDTTVCQYSDTFLLHGDPKGGTWSGINVTPPDLYSPDSAGVFLITYSRGSGNCLSQDQLQITVITAPVVNAGSDLSICYEEAPVILSGQPAGGIWDGVGITDSLSGIFDPSVSGIGSFTVYYAITDNISGCSNKDSTLITVRPLPEIIFGFDQPACVGEYIQFTNSCVNADSFTWDFGDGNSSTLAEPQHIYATAGNYLVRLTARSSFSCEASDTTTVNVAVPPPEPIFAITPKSGCSPLTIYFTIDASQYGPNASYSWDFGNGTTSNDLVPPDSIIYFGGLMSDTIYRISFRCYNSCGSKTYTDSILVFPTPLSGFEMLHDWDCTPVEVYFKNISKGLPDSFYWDLGDGTTSFDFEPMHTYTTGNSSTLYTIYLITTNDCGTDTLTQDLLVKPNTVDAFFSVDKFMGCEGDTFYFQNYSTDTSNMGSLNVAWDFGDGQGASDDNPSHIYQQKGTYTVKLHVDNGCGHDDVFDTLMISQTPDIEIISNNEACAGETLYFSYSTDTEISGRKWYFGDGDSSSLSNPFHTYESEGTYSVIMEGVSAAGFPACTGIAVKQILIKPTPQATISPDTSGCAPLQIVFQADSGSYHLWDFGDGSANSSNPAHVFETPGLFKVKLVSENTNQCRDMDSLEIRVFPTPESGFSYTTTGGYPEKLNFLNTSTGATGCYWDFGNGMVSSDCDITEPVEYYNTQIYTITLITSNQYGCQDTLSMQYGTGFKGLFVPNAFAPGHPDPGVNLFLPKGIGLLEYRIQVFDTWGNLIWESSELTDGSPSEGWDGKDKNGHDYPQDVYVWKAYAKFTDGTNWSGINGKPFGSVTLIR